MIAILSAGKSSRLRGANKLLVKACGVPVHEWHRSAMKAGTLAVAVVPSAHAQEVRQDADWLCSVIEHDGMDGPAGALLAYDSEFPHGDVVVLFADTLLHTIPDVRGDWVGVAQAPGRVWDYYDRATGWTRGVPSQLVCCGVYRFTDRVVLRSVLQSLVQPNRDTSMAEVLRGYAAHVPLAELIVDGWQDAGDFEALKRVHGKR